MSSMTSSMCRSMTGRPTRMQIANEMRRQQYGYYQNAKEIKERYLGYASNQPMRDGLESREHIFDNGGNANV